MIEDYSEAIRLDSESSASYFYRGTAYYFKNDYDNAISDFNEAIKREPKEPLPYYNRGLAYRKKGDEAGAKTDFDLRQAIDLMEQVVKVRTPQNAPESWAITQMNLGLALSPTCV